MKLLTVCTRWIITENMRRNEYEKSKCYYTTYSNPSISD